MPTIQNVEISQLKENLTNSVNTWYDTKKKEILAKFKELAEVNLDEIEKKFQKEEEERIKKLKNDWENSGKQAALEACKKEITDRENKYNQNVEEERKKIEDKYARFAEKAKAEVEILELQIRRKEMKAEIEGLQNGKIDELRTIKGIEKIENLFKEQLKDIVTQPAEYEKHPKKEKTEKIALYNEKILSEKAELEQKIDECEKKLRSLQDVTAIKERRLRALKEEQRSLEALIFRNPNKNNYSNLTIEDLNEKYHQELENYENYSKPDYDGKKKEIQNKISELKIKYDQDQAPYKKQLETIEKMKYNGDDYMRMVIDIKAKKEGEMLDAGKWNSDQAYKKSKKEELLVELKNQKEILNKRMEKSVVLEKNRRELVNVPKKGANSGEFTRMTEALEQCFASMVQLEVSKERDQDIHEKCKEAYKKCQAYIDAKNRELLGHIHRSANGLRRLQYAQDMKQKLEDIWPDLSREIAEEEAVEKQKLVHLNDREDKKKNVTRVSINDMEEKSIERTSRTSSNGTEIKQKEKGKIK